MIIHSKLDKPYESYTVRSMIWLQCDYCGKIFQRVKKSIGKLNKIVDKDSCGSKECTKAKKREIAILNYGAPSLFESKSFKEKQKATNLKKYGTEEYFDSNDFKKKRQKGMLEKHGVNFPLQSEEIKNKQIATCQSLYGVPNYSQSNDFAIKVKATSVKNFGVESPMQDPKVVEKKRSTSQERYGADNYTQTEEYKERRKSTCLKKYGTEHPSQLPENREKARKTCLKKYGEINYAKTKEFRERFIETCLKKYGVPNPFFLSQNQTYGKTQDELKEWLNSMGFNFKKNYEILQGKEIDLYDSNLKLGIEYCGLFWHNELSPQPRFRNYHHNKYIKCLKKKVRLITIFEDEWKNKREQCQGILKSILGKQTIKIYARKCEIREANKMEFKNFCNQYHLLASNNLGLVFFVLNYKNQIVGGMSLGRHHRQSNTITLDRLCFKPDTSVMGGASRLFKQCMQWAIKHNYKKIISWSDNRWSQGNVYKQLNFNLEADLPPDYSYVDAKKPYVRISKQSQKKELTGCPINITESEWSMQQGLARIWDCGKKRWGFGLE